MIAKECASCGGRFSAKSAKAQYCSPRCRVRATRQRQRDSVNPPPPLRREGPQLVSVPQIPSVVADEDGLAAQTRAELDAAGRLNTYQARAALYLAKIADAAPGDTGGGHASLMKQYMAAMAEALDGAQTKETAVESLRRRAQGRVGAA